MTRVLVVVLVPCRSVDHQGRACPDPAACAGREGREAMTIPVRGSSTPMPRHRLGTGLAGGRGLEELGPGGAGRQPLTPSGV